jgi:hypothetical protein
MRLNLCCFCKKIWKVFVKWGKFAAKLEFGLAFYNNKIKAFPFSRKLHLIFKITNDKELLNLGMYLSSFNSDEVSKEIERRMMQSDPIIYCKRATLKIAHYI